MSDLLFQPTCPRCCTICPSDSRYCAECGARLYLTERELDEITGHGLQQATFAMYDDLLERVRAL